MSENKELTTQSEKAVATSQEQLANDWGVPTTPSQDMLIPKILPMQGLSKLVVARKAQIGDFCDSVSGKKIGSIDSALEFIPFFCQKSWDISHQLPDGTYEYNRNIPLIENPVDKNYNDNLTWEGEEKNDDGKLVKVKRIRRLSFFVLLPSEIKAGGAIPYVLSFKSTSLKEGKKLWSQMYVRNYRAGLPPAAFHFNLGGTMQTNDKGTFVVPTVAEAAKSSQAEMQECLSWIKLINKGAVKVDTSDEDIPAADGAVSDEPTEF